MNFDQLIAVCRDPKRKEKQLLKQISKDGMADILADYVPSAENVDKMAQFMKATADEIGKLRQNSDRLLSVMERMEALEQKMASTQIENATKQQELFQKLDQSSERVATALDRMGTMEKEIETIKLENTTLKESLEKQAKTMKQHQMFIERLDEKERATNLVILGVAEGGEAEEVKVNRILETLSGSNQEPKIKSTKRLGTRDEGGRDSQQESVFEKTATQRSVLSEGASLT